MWRTISIAYTSPLHKWCGGFPKEMFTDLSVETVIAVWGQSTVIPDISIEYTQINEQPRADESIGYTLSSILSAQLCHTAANVFSLSLRLTKICDKTGFMRIFRVHTNNMACY
jgi:hypothetical protein